MLYKAMSTLKKKVFVFCFYEFGVKSQVKLPYIISVPNDYGVSLLG